MEPEVKKETLKMDPKLRTRAMVNSGILTIMFGMMTFGMIASGNTVLGIFNLIGTIGTLNDTLTFYYVNKES